jgi:hypothetical protein
MHHALDQPAAATAAGFFVPGMFFLAFGGSLIKSNVTTQDDIRSDLLTAKNARNAERI